MEIRVHCGYEGTYKLIYLILDVSSRNIVERCSSLDYLCYRYVVWA